MEAQLPPPTPLLSRRNLLRAGAASVGAVLAAPLLDACSSSDPNSEPAASSSSVVSPRQQGIVGSPSLNSARGTLLFVSNRQDGYQIYRGNVDLVQGQVDAVGPITNGPSNHMNPQVSPDGTWLTLYSDRDGGRAQIFRFPLANPERIERLTDGRAPCYDPVFTRDGKQILYKMANEDGSHGHICIMNADGTESRDLMPNLNPQYEAWKPEPLDENQVMFTIRKVPGDPNSDELAVLNLKENKWDWVTNNSVPDWFPACNPSTGQIAFVSKDQPGQNDGIFVLDKYARIRVTDAGLLSDFDDPSWVGHNGIVCVNRGMYARAMGHYAVCLIRLADQAYTISPLEINPNGDSLSPIIIPS